MSTFEHNKVDIYIKERNGKRNIRVPWLPASIEYKHGEQVVASYDILNKGQVDVPTGSGLATIGWTSQFPGENRKTDTSMLRGTYHKPSYYHDILKSWINKGTELNISVVGYPINMDVTLSTYEATPAGGFGDMEYSVEFTQDRDLTISAKKTKKRKSKTYTTYTVKKGDTLWNIAKKTLGSGSKWKDIYNANKSIIDKTAKKNGKKSSDGGWWIYPGTKLSIPKATSTSSSKGTKYKVTASALNVRSGPGTKYKVIKTIKKGTKVNITKTSGSWGYSPEQGGWMNTKYMKKA